MLAREIGLTATWRVADIGAGTGLSAELFVRHGNPVVGVEPNREMREAALRHVEAPGTFRMVDGTAEATTLPTNSVDLVVAAQAFHWFDPVRARVELRRILKPAGWVVLAWNTRRTDATPFLQAYEALLRRFGTDYDRVRHDRIGPEGVRSFLGIGLGSDEGGRGLIGRRILPNEQTLDRDGLHQRLLSTSYVPAPGEPGHGAMMAELDRIFDEHRRVGSEKDSGTVRILYDLELYWGR